MSNSYYYIAKIEDGIELRQVVDILSVPDGADILSELEITEYFPRMHLAATSGLHTIKHGKFSGRYLLPLDTSKRNCLLDYDIVKAEVIQEYDRKFNSVLEGKVAGMVEHLAKVQSFKLSFKGAIDSVTSSSNIRAVLGGQYYRDASDIGEMIRPILEEVDPPLKRTIFRLHQELQDRLKLDIKESADSLYQRIFQLLTTARKNPEGVPDSIQTHVITGFNSVFTFTLKRGYYNKTFSMYDDISACAVWAGDVEALASQWRLQYPNIVSSNIDDSVFEAVNTAARRIATAANIESLEGIAILKPIDNTKTTRLAFLKLLYRMKIYSITSEIRSEVDAIFDTYSVYVQKNSFSYYSYRYFSGRQWLDTEEHYMHRYLDELTGINEYVDKATQSYIDKEYTKKAIRKMIFKRLRKELYYAPSSRTKTK